MIMLPPWLRRSTAAQRFLSSQFDDVVFGGPFKGLRLPPKSFCSPRFSKQAGTYEKEIRPWIYELLEKPPKTVLDIGAAEGYYAVGFAKWMPDSTIIAFEREPEAMELFSECIRLNGPFSNLVVKDVCTPTVLEETLKQSADPLVFMDIDGGEKDLLDPLLVPSLQKAAIIVETHDYAVPEINQILEGRFSKTHDIVVQASEFRSVKDYPKPLTWWQRTFFKKHIVNALWDRYVIQEWLRMTPKRQ
jgi:precorrin-6B methylase 2